LRNYNLNQWFATGLINQQGCNASKEVLQEQREEDTVRLQEEREKRLAAIDARTSAAQHKGLAKGPGKLSAQLASSSNTTQPEKSIEPLNWN
jgi:hypothetical protein